MAGENLYRNTIDCIVTEAGQGLYCNTVIGPRHGVGQGRWERGWARGALRQELGRAASAGASSRCWVA